MDGHSHPMQRRVFECEVPVARYCHAERPRRHQDLRMQMNDISKRTKYHDLGALESHTGGGHADDVVCSGEMKRVLRIVCCRRKKPRHG